MENSSVSEHLQFLWVWATRYIWSLTIKNFMLALYPGFSPWVSMRSLFQPLAYYSNFKILHWRYSASISTANKIQWSRCSSVMLHLIKRMHAASLVEVHCTTWGGGIRMFTIILLCAVTVCLMFLYAQSWYPFSREIQVIKFWGLISGYIVYWQSYRRKCKIMSPYIGLFDACSEHAVYVCCFV